MMPHTVDLDDLLRWIEEGETAYVTFASSSGGNRPTKRLDVKLAGGYRVTIGEAVAYEGLDGSTAIKTYNGA